MSGAQVTEGTTALTVPHAAPTKGPKKKLDEPFYNPAMRLSRDVSVAVARVLAKDSPKPLTIADTMASLGARGLRLAHEVPNTHVVLNDIRLDSIHLAKQNLDRLGLKNADFRMGRLESLLMDNKFDWVDVDPFGTPAAYLDLAAAAVNPGGILAITATDKATLCGVYPDVCHRRYGARPLKGVIMHEVAARVLVGALARACGRRDRAIEPLLVHSTNHYVRAYVRVRDSADAANKQVASFASVWIGPDKTRHLTERPPAQGAWGGPVWADRLQDAAFVQKVLREAESFPRDTQRLLSQLQDEADAPALYYTTDEFTRGAVPATPPFETIIQRLREAGHVATRTHFEARAIKTDASPETFAKAVRL